MELFFVLLYATLLTLCWGSFLNVVAYRVSFDKPFFTARSYCPSCNHMIAWYDNIPLLSWAILCGKCRTCSQPISPIYPFIEGITALLMVGLCIKTFLFAHAADMPPLLATIPDAWFTTALLIMLPNFILFTALIIATATDLQAMIIPQFVSVWLIPVGLLFSYIGLITLSPLESMIGSLIGYGVLWATGFLFKKLTNKDGMGVGDMELLAMIGAFLGPVGVWICLIIGAFSGVILGSGYLMLTGHDKATRIPFAPFLALGACLYVLFKSTLIHFFIL